MQGKIICVYFLLALHQQVTNVKTLRGSRKRFGGISILVDYSPFFPFMRRVSTIIYHHSSPIMILKHSFHDPLSNELLQLFLLVVSACPCVLMQRPLPSCLLGIVLPSTTTFPQFQFISFRYKLVHI